MRSVLEPLKREKEQYISSSEIAEALIENNTDGVVCFNRDNKILLWNKAMELMFGISRQDALYKNFFSIFSCLTESGNEVNFQIVFDGIPVHPTNKFYHIDNTGKTGYFNADLFPLRNDDERIVAIAAIFHPITEKKNAEEKLNESLYFLKQISESTPDLIHIFDLEKRKVIYVNRVAYTTFGYTFEDLQSIPPEIYFQTLIHPDDIPNLMKRNTLFGSANNSDILETEYRLKHKDGNWRWVSSRGTVFKRNAEGKVVQYLTLIRDITEKKESEEQLRKLNTQLEENVKERTKALAESEDRFRMAIESTDLGMWDYNPRTDVLKWSDKSKELFAIPDHEEISFEQFLSTVVDEDLPFVKRKVAEALNKSSGGIYDAEYRIRTFNENKLKWISAKGKAYFNSFGEPIRFIGTMLDITERMQYQHNLRRKAEEFRTLAETIPQLVWTADFQGNQFYMNQRWQEYTGIYESHQLRNEFNKFVHPEDFEITMNIFNNCLQTGTPYKCELRLKRFDGQYRWHLSKASPVRDHNGVIRLWVGTLTDIHDQKEAIENLAKAKEQLQNINMQLRDKNKELLKINNDLDNFIYTASHDLKAPVSNIEGLLRTLEDALGEEVKSDFEYQEIMEMIFKSIIRFKNTIQDLTDITRIQKNITEDVAEVSIQELLEDIKLGLAEEIQSTGTIFKTEFEFDHIKFSKKDLKSILYNLISNAIKYRDTLRPPHVTISTSKTEDGILLSVKDNGLGIREDQKEKVFSMFKRLHDHVEGTGIGLYIVKRIMDNNGGSVEVFSELGKGSEFRLQFPFI